MTNSVNWMISYHHLFETKPYTDGKHFTIHRIKRMRDLDKSSYHLKRKKNLKAFFVSFCIDTT
jgi:hypothetical protein